jgi:hypothetical protein
VLSSAIAHRCRRQRRGVPTAAVERMLTGLHFPANCETLGRGLSDMCTTNRNRHLVECLRFGCEIKHQDSDLTTC